VAGPFLNPLNSYSLSFARTRPFRSRPYDQEEKKHFQERGTVMLKRIGMLALMLSATGVALIPKVAFAQDGYYARGDNYYRSDRKADRHENREWRGRERRDRRAEEWREHAARDREWRGHDHWADPYRHDYRRDDYCGSVSWR
jgi:hypothetical protein